MEYIKIIIDVEICLIIKYVTFIKKTDPKWKIYKKETIKKGASAPDVVDWMSLIIIRGNS